MLRFQASGSAIWGSTLSQVTLLEVISRTGKDLNGS